MKIKLIGSRATLGSYEHGGPGGRRLGADSTPGHASLVKTARYAV